MWAAVSLDGGVQFDAPFVLIESGLSNYALAWNDRYQNLLTNFVQQSAPMSLSVSEFRPQSIQPQGFLAGSTSFSAQVEAFDGGADLVWLLLSTTADGLTLSLGDGRQLGLGPSALYTAILPIALGGPLEAVPTAQGNGSTGAVTTGAAGIPPGLSVFAVGLGFDIQTISFTDLSDRVAINS